MDEIMKEELKSLVRDTVQEVVREEIRRFWDAADIDLEQLRSDGWRRRDQLRKWREPHEELKDEATETKVWRADVASTLFDIDEKVTLMFFGGNPWRNGGGCKLTSTDLARIRALP